ncbi:MAG: hypothetical protein IJX09_02240 [Clostridia bacterium]|nr:hypothetical protein [Clostridia bacterium]
MYKKIERFIPVIAAALGVIAIIMFFLPAITIKVGDEVVNYNGWQAIFGLTEKKDVLGSEVTLEYLTFSFMNLLTLILVAAGIVLCVLSFLGKGNKFFAFIAIACFIVAGVFFFLTVQFAFAGSAYATNLLGQELSQAEAKKGWALGAGPIVGGILSILAGLVVSVPVVVKLLKK